MSNFESQDGIDEQLEKIQDSAGELIEPCHYKSSFGRYGELRRLARSEKRLVAYLNGVFFQMDQSQYLLDFQTMKERAIELVSLLESEERSRQLQADFEPHAYEYLVQSMSSCAYENLAEATGQSDGYNSDGMHACIADGLQVCRQTGKLACVSCFREYSVDVYTAADDIELASYQCQTIIDHPGPWSDRGDRRWLACIKSAWLELLSGKISTARSLVDKAHQLIDSDEVSLKREATIRVLFCDATLSLMSGDDVSSHRKRLTDILPPAGECPAFELELALLDSLRAMVDGDYSETVNILTPWDRKLSQAKALTCWFEVRLRLIAAKRLAGETDRLDRLVQPLEKAALEASDWLTERRLQRLVDDDFRPSPLALLAELRPVTAPADSTELEADEYSPLSDDVSSAAEKLVTPLGDALDSMYTEMGEQYEKDNTDALDTLLDRIVAYRPLDVENPADAGRLIYYAGFLPLTGRAEEVWQWANALANAHEDHARTISVLAALGLTIRALEDDKFAETITAERLEQLYRKSLQLDGTIANNFSRAGDFYIQEENHGEAERCFARAFRLDRTSAAISLRLAEVYKMTDRPQDALNVLDLCLRNGCEEPSVTWQAALVAFGMDRFESTITYLDRFEKQVGQDSQLLWANYYRAVALYELGRCREALEAIEEEQRRVDMDVFHTAGIRACTRLALGRAEVDDDLEAFLAIPLRDVDYMGPVGIEQTLVRVWKAAEENLANDEVCDELKQRLLGAGMMPDQYFEELRQQNPRTSGLDFFRCMLQQPLDERWRNAAFSLDDQDDWPFYFAEWGVLAKNEEEAQQRVLHFQNECFPLPAEVVDVQASKESYEDHPGVVWQGIRFPGSLDEDDDGEDADGNDF
jgi:tetratricopeptide (TPR) repeat protein